MPIFTSDLDIAFGLYQTHCLKLDTVIMEEDEGVNHCVVINHDGSVVSDNATITVYGECAKKILLHVCFPNQKTLHIKSLATTPACMCISDLK